MSKDFCSKGEFLEGDHPKTIVVDEEGRALSVNTKGQLHVVLMGMLDTNNSTSTTLDANAVFTGEPTDTLDFGFIFITVFSDVASATDGLSVQQSSDGTNWDNLDVYTIPVNKGKTYSFQPGARFFRIVYTNGGTGQSAFRLQTIMKKTSSLPSSHRIQDAIVDEDDAELVKAVITGKTASGAFVNFTATNGGNFKVSLEELENAISVNSNTQLRATLFDVSGNEVIGEVQASPTANTVLARLKDLLTGIILAAGSNLIGIVKIGDGALTAIIDGLSSAFVGITWPHKEIHDGDRYFNADVFDLGNNASRVFLIVTPDTTIVGHFVFEIEFEQETKVTITRGVSVDANGTAITMVNRNENSGNTATIQLFHTPTNPTGGTVIRTDQKGSGKKVGGLTRDDNEIMLKRNTKYLIEVDNQVASPDLIDWCFDWYEHVSAT